VLVAVAVLQRPNNELKAVQLTGQGFSLDEQVMLPRSADETRKMLLELSPALRGDDALVREELGRAAKRAFRLFTGKRAAVVPVVVKV
jgi:ribonuclease J